MRIAPISPGTRPELAAQEARIAAARGKVLLLYQVLLNSPPVAHGWEQMLTAIRNHNSIPAGLRELAIVRVAVLNGAAYESEVHVPIALAAGVSQASIDATLQQPLCPEALASDDERLVLELTDTMTRDIQVPDALYARVAERFDAQGIVDLTATIAAYNMVSRFLVALQIQH
jgi:AhpD family alkylhydroperoxidase